ncbi:asparagine synthase-related protein [Rhodopirellula sp. MGV]|uniref:asparagine synthase-related protein n=1 Tax=Rhodopirellula sp. MGV TaxID=2023130 RepID=UPI001E5AAB7D|nr:asparagine synthase-related protein [Rhodopirellula sp. MGV]
MSNVRPEPSNSSATTSAGDCSDELGRLREWFGNQSVVVAFSGGVDSSVVLAAALGSAAERVVAVTAVSPSVAGWQIEIAKQVAEQLGAEHRLIQTSEVELPEYRVNDRNRCFHCKSTLYETLYETLSEGLSDALDVTVVEESRQNLLPKQADSASNCNQVVVSGTNADDLGDYRPGIAAGDQAGVRKPLAELGFGKSIVRQLAAEMGLSNADLPASPCLASRIAYGVEVTPARLKMIESAETLMKELGVENGRVRLHEGDLARIEVPAELIPRLLVPDAMKHIATGLRSIGFQYVTVDLEGFQSGSMNRPLVSIEVSAK